MAGGHGLPGGEKGIKKKRKACIDGLRDLGGKRSCTGGVLGLKSIFKEGTEDSPFMNSEAEKQKKREQK